jgi:pyruvate formate lyase activating enzyme
VQEPEKLLQHSTVREASLYQRLSGERVKCGVCKRRCLILPGQKGFCKTRLNVGGKLYTLVYGDLSALESRPIEIKPFFHYWPGSTALTFSTWSCNLDCVWCQNHHLSKSEPDPARGRYYSPEKVVEQAVSGGDKGLCASFQEPTLLLEWLVPLFRRGRERGLYCCCVSNGYMTSDALQLLKDSGMDGFKTDVKGDAETYHRYCGGVDVENVWRTVQQAKELDLHVEIVNLVVTGVNDDDDHLTYMIERHLKEAGAETPLHFTRYYPAYRLNNPPTSVKTLEKAYEMAKKAGVLYPYVGNIPAHRYENTYCPACGEKLIQRLGCTILAYRLSPENRCPKCGEEIAIVGEPARFDSMRRT